MNKRFNKIAMAIALSLVLLAGVFAATHNPASDPVATDGTDETSTPAYMVTIQYTDPNTKEVLSSETVSVLDDGMIFTPDEDRGDELCTLTIQRLDGDGQEDGPAEIVHLSVGMAYAVGVPYAIIEPSTPDTPPELPAPPAPPTFATATANTSGSHETFESLIEKGIMKPYQIPGFPIAGPFWEKYGMPDSEMNQSDSADAATEAEADEVYVLTITYYDPEGNQIAPPVTKEVPVCDVYYIGFPSQYANSAETEGSQEIFGINSAVHTGELTTEPGTKQSTNVGQNHI